MTYEHPRVSSTEFKTAKEAEMRETEQQKGLRKRSKKRKRAQDAREKKRVYETARSRTRINIGAAFDRWRELRDLKGMKTDAELAFFLLRGVTPANTDEDTISADEFENTIVDFEEPKCQYDEDMECFAPLEKCCPATG